MSNKIYKITCSENSNIYIGSTGATLSQRFKCHLTLLKNNKHYSELMQYDFNKFGLDNFNIELIEDNDDDYKEDREYQIIKQFDLTHILYNKFKGINNTTIAQRKKLKIDKAILKYKSTKEKSYKSINILTPVFYEIELNEIDLSNKTFVNKLAKTLKDYRKCKDIVPYTFSHRAKIKLEILLKIEKCKYKLTYNIVLKILNFIGGKIYKVSNKRFMIKLA